MSIAPWDLEFQRAYLASLLDGGLGQDPSVLQPDLFTEELYRVAKGLLRFRTDHDAWPSREYLSSIFSDINLKEEVAKVLAVRPPARNHAARVGVLAARKRAMQQVSISLAETAELDPGQWNIPQLMGDLEKAASLGAPGRPPYDIAKNILSRHQKSTKRSWTYGIDTLDKIKGGGLLAGEIVFLFGATKVGKSHLAVHIAASNLLAGVPVIHISLENSEEETMRRYDRRITRMTTDQIMSKPDAFEDRWRSLWEPGLLKLHWFTRYSIGTRKVKELIQDAAERFGQMPLVVLDYGSLLSGMGQEEKVHEQVGRIHGALASMAQEMDTAIVTPFQANRAGIMSESGLGLQHAGESYASFQHADTIIAMQQGSGASVNRLVCDVIGARNSASGQVTCYADKSISYFREWEESK